MTEPTFTVEQIHDAMFRAWSNRDGLKSISVSEWSNFLHDVVDNLTSFITPPDGAYRSPEKTREQQLAARRRMEEAMKQANPQTPQPPPVIIEPAQTDLGTPPPSRRKRE